MSTPKSLKVGETEAEIVLLMTGRQIAQLHNRTRYYYTDRAQRRSMLHSLQQVGSFQGQGTVIKFHQS